MPQGGEHDRRRINAEGWWHLKVAIIGGAGVRVPLLVGGLARSDLRITEISLYDIDRDRLAVIANLASQMAGDILIRSALTPEPAIEGARFVITSIRVGGAAQRAQDEATALAHGVIGQETIGPAGFAMAVRSIPPMIDYGRLIARYAPRAWMINFTNPVSIITQAIHQETDARVIGICDTPMELFEDAAHALGLPASVCGFDYFGLNHLGWLRDVIFEGEGQLQRIWEDEAKVQSAYRSALFESSMLRELRLLPTEYLYYYYRPDVALANMTRAGFGRGELVARMTAEFFREAGSSDNLVDVYRDYLAKRDASYMQLETASPPRIKPDWAELSGYDRIALFTLRAIAKNQGAIIPLNVANHGTLPFLDDNDIIEAQCRVVDTGPQPRAVAPVPEGPRRLIEIVKTYERATIRAALSGERSDLIDALALNPLVPTKDLAERLVAAML
jgi:6-phospho-beta-glucosidase